MRAFSFDRRVVNQYEAFSRSFTRIRAKDLGEEVEKASAGGRFWPDPLLSINPAYEQGASASDLADQGLILPETADVFRIGGQPLRFYAHQELSISKATIRNSFVVTTGTGSGKSLCFFVPIVDQAIRARKAGEQLSTRAIIVYPMNALANSQIEEIDKFLEQSGLPNELKPRVARYTGQESGLERKEVADNPPDILLTNFMMLELLMTRQDDVDSAVIANASGLEFIVLDELHTYRGRQGADVAILVRRLKDRCRGKAGPICIGTSATMASEGEDEKRSQSVANVSSRLFGDRLESDAVVDERLRRSTNPSKRLDNIEAELKAVVGAPIPDDLPDEDLRNHPLAVWLELAVGLDDSKGLHRRKPVPISEVAERLSELTELPASQAREYLEEFLASISRPERERGGEGEHAFMAFKLHRFVAGAGEILTTLRAQPRNVLFEGQKTDPNDREARLYPTRFCRECGQEYHAVTLETRDGERVAIPREIDETPLTDEEGGNVAGYLTPAQLPTAQFQFSGEIGSYPEDWVEQGANGSRLRSNRRKSKPYQVELSPDGRINNEGRQFWFVPGKFGFCLACGNQPSAQARERNKIGGLTAEGRSSATTTLVTAMLEALNTPDSGVPEGKRKTLGFTDNRQDAALQSGHFNDSIFISLLRGAILRAVLDAGDEGLTDENFGRAVQRALGFLPENECARHHWMLNPDVKGAARIDAGRALAHTLAHRVWADQRRGWRFTYPNLTGLALVRPDFLGLSELVEDDSALANASNVLSDLEPQRRDDFFRSILTTMLEGLAVDTEALDKDALDPIAQRSRSLLCAPWAIDRTEEIRSKTALAVSPPARSRMRRRDSQLLLSGGFRSGLARRINRESVLGKRLSGEEFDDLMRESLALLEDYALVRSINTALDIDGWQLQPSCVVLLPGAAVGSPDNASNTFFHGLYSGIAQALTEGMPATLGFEAREHTAQVSQQAREWREWRFRNSEGDSEKLEAKKAEIQKAGETTTFLPALFCSPTMELGVDISALNAVYLRNVPPTPANYAQRAGRAGRSGQAAVITTYCAAQSPHDQYYFRRRREMVAGIVRPPALDLGNEELVRSHLQAVWLAESGQQLASDIPKVLDLEKEGAPLRDTLRDALCDPSLAKRAIAPMRRVLEAIYPHISPPMPEALADGERFVEAVANNAATEFDKAFDRWRGLYMSALKQLHEANARSQQTGLSRKERARVKAAQAQANEQISILEDGRATSGSDFYTYRYLATEGFLPGYNFPRLPLYAYVPGSGSDRQGAYLQRARFLAISEFGPRSLIYHEGRAYRVHRAKLGADAIGGDGRSLATSEFYVCPACGGAHRREVERCDACASQMADATPIRKTLRIDNVETLPAERITANDEERQRQGFDVLTVFAWPRRSGRIDVKEARMESKGGCLATLQYGEGAEISRLNLGLRRRREQSIFGFAIEPSTGRWTKLEDEDDEKDPEEEQPVRIVPVVQDNKNALVLRLTDPERYEPATLTTLQHALLRGIEIVFQLEEGEILSEPLPKRDDRRAILFYEATEGGAGVLGRLIRDEYALHRVAASALEVMHYDQVEEALGAVDPAQLEETDEAPCVNGCYRCLLSYYNQPDHEEIDRLNSGLLELLVAFATGSLVRPQTADKTDPWRAAFEQAGLVAPDAEGIRVGDVDVPYVWRGHYVAATPYSVTAETRETAAAEGWELFMIPDDGSYGVPIELKQMLKETA